MLIEIKNKRVHHEHNTPISRIKNALQERSKWFVFVLDNAAKNCVNGMP